MDLRGRRRWCCRFVCDGGGSVDGTFAAGSELFSSNI